MSFKESLALTDLPVITFYQGNLKVNFLLDSGSNYSHIIPSAVDKLKGEVINSSIEISGIGKGESSKLFRTTLEYNKKHFAVDLYLTEHLVQAFIDIKKETGVSIHGILGNKFFQDYKYILDFNKLEAYSAK